MNWLTRMFRVAEQEPPQESRSWSVGDPRIAEIFGGAPSLSGVSVTETSAMGLSAVNACVGLLSEVIGGLPLRTIQTNGDTHERTTSWLDEPGGIDGPTSNEFVASLMVNLLLAGNFYALKVRGGAGQILWLQSIPPQCVDIEVKNGRKVYRVQMDNGTSRDFSDYDILHIPGPSLDGVRGYSPITIARNSLGMSLAGERTAARFMDTGFRPSAIVSPTEEISEEEAEEARQVLELMATGQAKSGALAFLSKGFQIDPWTVNPVDAQWLESRKFQLAEVARWFRVPPHMIADVERSSSWGTGIAEQVLGFQKFTLQSWTSRIEARLSRLLPVHQKVEFDFKQLFKGTQAEQIKLLTMQCGGPYRTPNEVRRIDDLPPIEGGDVLRTGPASQPDEKEVAA
ncbi:phage portal protein [Mycobacterium sp. BMJ-28]